MDLHNILIPLRDADVKKLRTILKRRSDPDSAINFRLLDDMGCQAGTLGALLRGAGRGERGVMRRKDFGR